ncbi:unnamed protein product [Phytophthora fragariaefolia]|uniref:Unnamed protein product n=1 Tax=Phytophthora fragariaefolia TaxID=1490495 RepID=A0A9W6XYQ2_9STRA|nr:unnamed protein product [Phytophthora fragariaefolia]
MPIGRRWRRWSVSWAKQPSLDFPTSPQSSRGRAWNASTTEAQGAAQASATNTAAFAACPTTTKPVKMSVQTFDGKDSDSLVFWVREIEIALSAGQIYDAQAQVAFELSNLGERARAWAMAREMATPGTPPRGRSWNRSYALPSSLPMWRIVTAPISCDACKASGRFKATSWGSITSKPPWPAHLSPRTPR